LPLQEQVADIRFLMEQTDLRFILQKYYTMPSDKLSLQYILNFLAFFE
jgi:hypothetical protein